MSYDIPVRPALPNRVDKEVLLAANGDLRLSANRNCWAAQKEMETSLNDAVSAAGYTLRRVHDYDEEKEHGFIDSQKMGLKVLSNVCPVAPIIIAEAVWQYSHHLLGGLNSHRGNILTIANWSGTWPGLVGMLNLNGSLTKAGTPYSTLWAEDFAAADFQEKLSTWLSTGKVSHPIDHVVSFDDVECPDDIVALARALAEQFLREKAIMGVFDEGCMGMFNAIIPDHLLNPTGVYKERLSQSALYHETMQVSDDEADEVRSWMEERGMKFHTGPKHEDDLTDDQIRLQCKMYIASVRIADDFGCAAIGIQYQQGLKDLLPASDLVEGTLNNWDRPPVLNREGTHVLYSDQPIPHFNEVDECAGVRRINDVSSSPGDEAGSGEHSARSSLGRLGCVRHHR